MRITTALVAALFAGLVFAKLPPPTEDAKAKAARSAFAQSPPNSREGQAYQKVAIAVRVRWRDVR
jgi:hypothetical protein